MDKRDLDNCIKSFKKNGDNQHYEKIYRFFYPRIYRFVLLNVSGSQAAEDICIDVFYNVYRHISKVNVNSSSIQAWIYKIARNLIIDYYRKEAKNSENFSLDEYLEDKNDGGFEAAVEIDEALIFRPSTKNGLMEGELDSAGISNMELLKGLNRLNEIQRQVIILRFVEGMDYKSIGIVINKNEITVRAIKFRAISRLKEMLIR